MNTIWFFCTVLLLHYYCSNGDAVNVAVVEKILFGIRLQPLWCSLQLCCHLRGTRIVFSMVVTIIFITTFLPSLRYATSCLLRSPSVRGVKILSVIVTLSVLCWLYSSPSTFFILADVNRLIYFKSIGMSGFILFIYGHCGKRRTTLCAGSK